jgi:hypothetical protein
MNTVVVRRRIARQVMMLAAAVFLVLAAFDIIWLHQVSGPPEVDEEAGQITSGGLSEQRTDYLWGALFLVAGAGLAAVAVAGLVSRAPVLVADEEALRLRISGPNGYLEIPWEAVRWLHSGSEGDDELVPNRVFLVHVDDPSPYPSKLWDAEWDGGTLEVDADSWTMPPEEVAVRCRLALEAWRREHQSDLAEPDGAEAPGQTDEAETAPTTEAATVAAIPPDDPGAPEAEPAG